MKALAPHAVGQPIILIVLIYNRCNPFLAFVVSDCLGQLIAATCVCISERAALRTVLRARLRIRHIGKLASSNAMLPTLNLTAAASAFLFATTPLFFLSGLSNGILAGTLALLFRILDVPANLTSSSLSAILMKEVADHRPNNIFWSLRSTFLLPVAIATLVFSLICLGGFTLKSLAFMPSWQMALAILPAVALFQAGIAAAAPLIDIAAHAGRQKGLFAINIISVGLAILTLLLWKHDPIFAILMAGLIGFLRVAVMSVWLVRPGERFSSATMVRAS